ncbi:hypothetical protein [Krasilnikovia sp. MM14-A1259]|uniref:hypothetical protein n=1 Tax=Krasilnikovia sp. MM14-A1259 TaxID=3373539 RepID=UPI0038002269
MFDLQVDTDEVRRVARDVAATGARVAAGVEPPPPVTVPRWDTCGAVVALAGEAHRFGSAIADGLAATGHDLRTTADAYDDADARAAARLAALG